MAKLHYQGYSEAEKVIPLREKFGSVNAYGQDAKTLLTKASGFISAYDFTLNPYKGCQYGCSYCYAAAFSPNQKMRQDWGNWVIIKQNAAQLLEKELKTWNKRHPDTPPSIYMSTVTDPYQPIESKAKLTRELLTVMVAYQPTLVIQTRSPAIVRDLDILKQFQRLRINMSVPTGSESVRKDFEPRSPSIKARLKAVGTLKHSIPFDPDRDIRFSITVTPVLPTLPAEEITFIRKLEVADRVVIQPFHQFNARSLVAGTRASAEEIIQKYQWWYQDVDENYQNFKQKLGKILSGVEIKEGQEGFTYD
jgi:DNA repair photolyase